VTLSRTDQPNLVAVKKGIGSSARRPVGPPRATCTSSTATPSARVTELPPRRDDLHDPRRPPAPFAARRRERFVLELIDISRPSRTEPRAAKRGSSRATSFPRTAKSPMSASWVDESSFCPTERSRIFEVYLWVRDRRSRSRIGLVAGRPISRPGQHSKLGAVRRFSEDGAVDHGAGPWAARRSSRSASPCL